MTIIDLLNKIANGEEVPKKIKYANCIYYLDDEWIDVCYRREDNKRIFEEFFVFENLNDKVEIIEDTPEDNKIEYFDDYKIDVRNIDELIDSINLYIELSTNKLNQIIDKINREE